MFLGVFRRLLPCGFHSKAIHQDMSNLLPLSVFYLNVNGLLACQTPEIFVGYGFSPEYSTYYVQAPVNKSLNSLPGRFIYKHVSLPYKTSSLIDFLTSLAPEAVYEFYSVDVD